jgi:hypothetical protein
MRLTNRHPARLNRKNLEPRRVKHVKAFAAISVKQVTPVRVLAVRKSQQKQQEPGGRARIPNCNAQFHGASMRMTVNGIDALYVLNSEGSGHCCAPSTVGD